MQRKTDLIKPRKLQSLLDEGFELEYLENIMTPKFSKDNPTYDLNEDMRAILGLYGHNLVCQNNAAMTNSRLSQTPSPQSTQLHRLESIPK